MNEFNLDVGEIIDLKFLVEKEIIELFNFIHDNEVFIENNELDEEKLNRFKRRIARDKIMINDFDTILLKLERMRRNYIEAQ